MAVEAVELKSIFRKIVHVYASTKRDNADEYVPGELGNSAEQGGLEPLKLVLRQGQVNDEEEPSLAHLCLHKLFSGVIADIHQQCIVSTAEIARPLPRGLVLLGVEVDDCPALRAFWCCCCIRGRLRHERREEESQRDVHLESGVAIVW